MSADRGNSGFDAIVLDAGDTVATALRALATGETARIHGGNRASEIVLRGAVPFGHKLALAAIAPGDAVLKYGTSIGRATARIEPGDHVHIHNLISERARPKIA